MQPSIYPLSDYKKYADYANAQVIVRQSALFEALQEGGTDNPVFNYYTKPFYLIRISWALSQYYDIGVLNEDANYLIEEIIQLSQSSLN